MRNHIIRTERATKYYNRGRANEVLAVNDISLEIVPGDFAVLKGPSGSGKTTLLSLIGCMTRPTSGSVTVAGKDVSHLPERFLTGIRRKTFGFIFQQFNLIQGLTVLQNVMAPLFPANTDIGFLRSRAVEILDSLGMSGRADFPVQGLSGGEQQRTAIARALINDPEIILADEPTAHLDTVLSKEFMAIMKQLNKKGKTIIIATHDPLVFEAEALDLPTGQAGMIAEMRDGSVINISRVRS